MTDFLNKKNNAKSILSQSITDSDLSLIVVTPSAFPTYSPFHLTIWNKDTYPDPSDDPLMEIIKVTAIGGAPDYIFTIERAKENTTAHSHISGHAVELLITTEHFTEIEDEFLNYLAKNNTTSYTPTEDYHPATKLYVDSQIGGENHWDMLSGDILTPVVSGTDILLDSGSWIGLGSAAGRITFTDAATDVVSIDSANFAITNKFTFDVATNTLYFGSIAASTPALIHDSLSSFLGLRAGTAGNLFLRLGDSIGAKSLFIQDVNSQTVAYVDSNGNAHFTSVALAVDNFLSFENDPDTGIVQYYGGFNQFSLVVGGTEAVGITTAGVYFNKNIGFSQDGFDIGNATYGARDIYYERQLKSNVAIGTAPMTITSTTLVTNLNADLLDGKHVGTTGNVIPLLDGLNTWSGTNLFSIDSNTDVIFKDTRAVTGNNIVGEWQDLNGNMLMRLAYSNVGDKDLEIRFGDDENTMIGFPEAGYFAFKNDVSEFWLGSTGDPSLYFNYYVGSNLYFGAPGNLQAITFYQSSVNFAGTGDITLGPGVDFICFGGVGSGNKIGTAVTQKIGFWNATPVSQRASANQAAVSLDVDVTGTDTVDKAAVDANFSAIQTLLNQIRADLVTIGILKGSS